jgi:hypothetical protein
LLAAEGGHEQRNNGGKNGLCSTHLTSPSNADAGIAIRHKSRRASSEDICNGYTIQAI